MVELTLDSGSSHAGQRLSPLYRAFNRVFGQYCKKQYTEEVEAFSIVLRASGKVADFQFEGCDAVKVIRSMNIVTADLGIPEERWRGPDQEFLPYFTDQIWDCVEACIELLEKKGKKVDREGLREDYQKATVAFLSEHLGSS